MPKAIWIWRQFPRQIASDLSRFHHRRITEWHHGDMGSYELLELIEHLPDDGAFKTAVRGDWDEKTYMLAATHNVLERLLAGYYAVHCSGDDDTEYEPFLLRSPAELKEEATARAAEEVEQRQDDELFYADMGWS